MWNAYTNVGNPLPGRDVKFNDIVTNDITVNGTINSYESFFATVIQEDGSSLVTEFAVLRFGDIINLYIPEISVTAATYTQAYKSVPIPADYRPLAAGQSQAIVTNQNATPGIGSCYFPSTSELRLYTKPDRTNPTNASPAITRQTMFSYFKGL